MAGNKRRRGTEGTEGGLADEKTAQTSKCKGATTIPIFLKSKFTCFRTPVYENISSSGYKCFPLTVMLGCYLTVKHCRDLALTFLRQFILQKLTK